MFEGFKKKEVSVPEEDTVEAFRAKLDQIITDEEAGYGYRKNALVAFIQDMNNKRSEVEKESPEYTAFQELAQEAEAKLLEANRG